MLVLGRWQTDLDQAQAAGHAQVADQAPGFGLDQQVFGTPLNALDTLPGQLNIQVFWNWPTQTPLANDNPAYALAFKKGRDAAASGFNFGELRHDQQSEEAIWMGDYLSSNAPEARHGLEAD
jgi:hypothetical protein